MFLDTTDLRDQEIYLDLYKTADENKEKGYVPAYYFKIIRRIDDIEVGKCDLRIGHNDNIKYGGNIGYEVYESYRANHYASKACKLLFVLAKRHNMDQVIITCAPDNIASQKLVSIQELNISILLMCLHGMKCIKMDERRLVNI